MRNNMPTKIPFPKNILMLLNDVPYLKNGKRLNDYEMEDLFMLYLRIENEERLKIIMVKRYIDGLSLKEIGKLFGVGPMSIRYSEMRALRKLFRLYKEEYIDE